MKRNRILMIVISSMLLASLACSVNIGGGDPTPTAEVEKLIRPTAEPEVIDPTAQPEAPTQAPVVPTAEPQQPAAGGGEDYANYIMVADDLGIIEMLIPSEWNDIDGAPIGDEAASLWAGTDLAGLGETWNAPGVMFDATNRYDIYGTPIQYLDDMRADAETVCQAQPRQPYTDGMYTGYLDRFDSCGGTNTSIVVVAAEPDMGEQYMATILVQIVSPKDEKALQQILESFRLVGSLDALGGSSGGSSSSGSSGYITVTDDYNSISVDVPASWTDVDGSYWVDDDQVIGATIYASADLDAFLSTWEESGIIFRVSDDVVNFFGGYIMMLDWRSDFFRDGTCELDGRYDYEDPLYEGKYDLFKNCGGPGGPYYMVLSTRPIDDPLAYNMLVEIQFENDMDLDYVTEILDTFVVTGVLP